MALYHFNAKIIGRSQGRSATGAAAYRAGVRIEDARTGLVFDYTRKRGVDGAEILTPDGTPVDRAALHNEIERAESRGDGQLLREVECSLPRELTQEQMRELIRDFVRTEFVARGMVADIAFHHLTGANPHAHVLLSLREWKDGGFGLKRRDWNERALCEHWRAAWAEHANAALAQAGHAARVDHRTLVEQAATALQEQRHEDAAALDRAPTIHERGSPSAAAHNAAVVHQNAARLAEWQAVERTAHVEAIAHEEPRTCADLAAQDLEHRQAMRGSREPKALRWRFHDDQVLALDAWLARKLGGDKRRLAAYETAVRDLQLARIAWGGWQQANPRPFWPWRWPRWQRQRDDARALYSACKRGEKRAERHGSPEVIEAWRRAYAVKQAEHAGALAARRRIAPTPSEQVQARRERQACGRASARDQIKAWAPPLAKKSKRSAEPPLGRRRPSRPRR